MVTDSVLNFSSESINGILSALPQLQLDVDLEPLQKIFDMFQMWNNWLPVDALVQAMALAFTIWASVQAIQAAMKMWEMIKP